jgi:hypothetical protein
MSKISINYTPDLIDEAIREHVQRTMGISSDIEIHYTHKRRTRRVSAEILIPVRETQDTSTIDLHSSLPADYGFDDLPKHEQEEATEATESESSDDSMFGDMPEQEVSEEESESEDLFA